MFDLSQETPIPLKDACRFVPPARRGKRTHLSTLLRWVMDGVRSPTGAVVRLEAIRLGNRWHTSRAALQRFAEALTPIAGSPSPTVPRTSATRQRAAKRAGEELEQLGI